jgi:hypothetical protein
LEVAVGHQNSLLLGLPETPAVSFVPARIARIAGTKRPNRQPWFGPYIKRRAVYPQVLEKEYVPPLGQQFDRFAEIQTRYFFV